MEEQIKLEGWYLKYELIKEWFIPHDIWLPWKHISIYSRQNINILRDFLREHCLKLNLLQFSHSMFCKNVARLAVARGCHTWIRSPATAKRAIFLQNILWESCSKFNFKQCSLKKFLKILIFWREYMEIGFHGNRILWGINHSLISLYFKYQLSSFFCSSLMLNPIISSLDEIYCISSLLIHVLSS